MKWSELSGLFSKGIEWMMKRLPRNEQKNATRFGKVLKFIIKIFRLFSPLGQLSTTYDVHTCWGQILGFFEFCYTFKVSELTLNLDLIFVVLICRKFLGAAEKRRGCTDGGAVKGYKVLIFIVLILFWKVSNNEKQHIFFGEILRFLPDCQDRQRCDRNDRHKTWKALKVSLLKSS